MLIKSLRPKVRDACATEILGEREFLFIPPPTGLVPPLPGSFVGGKPQWLHPVSLYASPKASTEQNLLDRVLQAEAVDLRRVEDKIELRPFNGVPAKKIRTFLMYGA